MTKKKAAVKKKAPAKKKAAAKKKKVVPKKKGRPSGFNWKLADDICAQLAIGKSLRNICQPESMPAVSSVYKWLRENDDFSNQYARAREDQADYLADEIIEIADDGRNDFMEDDEGNMVVDHEHIQRSRLRVDARKFLASKLKPKKYGDSTMLKHSGQIDGRPLVIIKDFTGSESDSED